MSSKKKFSPESLEVIKVLFKKIDLDGDGNITKQEATTFWKGKFGKASVDQMFGATDDDLSRSVSWEEYMKFWNAVLNSGYTEEEIKEEVEAMIQGETWREWGKVEQLTAAIHNAAEQKDNKQ